MCKSPAAAHFSTPSTSHPIQQPPFTTPQRLYKRCETPSGHGTTILVSSTQRARCEVTHAHNGHAPRSRPATPPYRRERRWPWPASAKWPRPQAHWRRRGRRQLERILPESPPRSPPHHLPPRTLLLARRRLHVFRRHRQRFLCLTVQHPRRRIQPHHQPLAAHHHPADPLAQHLGPHAQFHHNRDRSPPHVPRHRCHGGVVRPGQAYLPPRPAVAARDLRPRLALSHRPDSRLAPARYPGNLLPFQHQQPLVLHHHLRPRLPPLRGGRRAHRRACRPLCIQKRGKPPDHGRLHRLVLALHGHPLAHPLHSARLFPISRNCCSSAKPCPPQNSCTQPRPLTYSASCDSSNEHCSSQPSFVLRHRQSRLRGRHPPTASWPHALSTTLRPPQA